jgi:hypothetical protein
MSNLGLKHSDVYMSMKRMPVNMSVEDVIEKPMHFKKGGKVMGVSIAIMPAKKMGRMKKPCMSKGGMMGSEDKMYKKGGLAQPVPADKMHRLKTAKPTKGYSKGGAMYAEGGLVNTKSISSSKLMSKAINRSK